MKLSNPCQLIFALGILPLATFIMSSCNQEPKQATTISATSKYPTPIKDAVLSDDAGKEFRFGILAPNAKALALTYSFPLKLGSNYQMSWKATEAQLTQEFVLDSATFGSAPNTLNIAINADGTVSASP